MAATTQAPNTPLAESLPVRDLTAPRTPAPLQAKKLSPRRSPQPLTGVAALTDARRVQQQEEAQETARQVSPNPKTLAINALMGSQETSKATSAPQISRTSSPLRSMTETVTVPISKEPRPNGTPRMNSSREGAAMTVTASPTPAAEFTEEPESMEDNGPDNEAQDEEEGNRPFTYPGPAPSRLQETPTRRDMSMPGSGNYDSGTKSAKRHKCPYCSTDFTRHHNLKSHLLTHSQEKPYVCPTCSARFRRLHDLKRHTKLHTGERPHTCPKCGRKFARGDALARHNKGPGGCANRKSSFGQDDGEDGDDTMDGIEYDNDQDESRLDDSELADEHGRRVSEPSRKRPRQDTSYDSTPYRQHSSTYPPTMSHVMRQEAAQMGPPSTLLSPTSRTSPSERHNLPPAPQPHHADPHYQSQYYPQPAGSSYPAPVVTESPRPLSPRGQEQQRLSVSESSGLRNRSASVNSNYQSPSYAHRGSVQSVPPQAHMAPHPPQLPPLPSLAANHHTVQPPPIVAPPAGFPGPQSHPHSAGGMGGSGTGSMSSHGHSSSGSIREILGSDPQDIYAYVRSLEQRFSRMQDEYELRISRLQADVIELRAHFQQGR